MQRISHIMRPEHQHRRRANENHWPRPAVGLAAFDLELLSVPRAILVIMLRDYLQHLAPNHVEWELNPAGAPFWNRAKECDVKRLNHRTRPTAFDLLARAGG
jgi:hypothetical protein